MRSEILKIKGTPKENCSLLFDLWTSSFHLIELGNSFWVRNSALFTSIWQAYSFEGVSCSQTLTAIFKRWPRHTGKIPDKIPQNRKNVLNSLQWPPGTRISQSHKKIVSTHPTPLPNTVWPPLSGIVVKQMGEAKRFFRPKSRMRVKGRKLGEILGGEGKREHLHR